MYKLKAGTPGSKVLKAIHIFCITLWIGGLLTWVPLTTTMPLKDIAATQITYLNLRSIAWNVIGWGGIGSFVTGLLNGLLTSWGLFKHTWIKTKLILTIAMILFGMFYTEQKMLSNIRLLDSGNSKVLETSLFLANHGAIQAVVPIQLAVFFVIVLISVFKPWMKSDI
ncbi:MAG TPA: hypothetical protein VK625_19775 [Flavitalea sp.]|nr:hypothetical protein [Flavitalea sp.]